MLVFSVNSHILVFCCRAGVGRWSAERRRSARGIWLEATHAINVIVVTVAVAMLLDLRVSQATQMPWCAGTSKSISGIARGEQADTAFTNILYVRNGTVE
jgi:hypothetical protein